MKKARVYRVVERVLKLFVLGDKKYWLETFQSLQQTIVSHPWLLGYYPCYRLLPIRCCHMCPNISNVDWCMRVPFCSVNRDRALSYPMAWRGSEPNNAAMYK